MDTFARNLTRNLLLTSILLCLSQSALANPMEGSVVQGQANIQSADNTLTVTQTSDRAVINWQSFNIGNNEITQFTQPQTSSITLNRVTNNQMSRIDGKLQANGNIFLINPAGVVFGKNAEINLNSLLASTGDVKDDDFMNPNGSVVFTEKNGTQGSIINHGKINATGNHGYVLLLGNAVKNDGLIQTNHGTVMLDAVGGNTAVDENGEVMKAAVITTDKSIIRTEGGNTFIRATIGGRVVENALNLSGVVDVSSSTGNSGGILIEGTPSAKSKISNLKLYNRGQDGRMGAMSIRNVGKVTINFSRSETDINSSD